MKLTTCRNDLVIALGVVTAVTPKRGKTDALECVLIDARDGQLSLAASNLDQSLHAAIRAQVATPGRILANARQLDAFARSGRSRELTIETAEDGTCLLVSDGTTAQRVKTVDMNECWPVLRPSQVTTSVISADLAKAFQAVDSAMSSDATRYALNSVLMDVSDGVITLVATDGRRMHIANLSCSGSAERRSVAIPAEAIAPIAGVLACVPKLDVCGPRDSDGPVCFVGRPTGDTVFVDEIRLFTHRAAGDYPNYRQVIPKKGGHTLRLDRRKFSEILDRMALVCDERSTSVRLILSEDGIAVAGGSSSVGDARETILVSGHSGAAVTIGIHPGNLMDTLDRSGSDVVDFAYKDAMSPVTVSSGESFLGIVVPTRVM